MSFSDVPRDVASGHLFGALLALPDVCLQVLPAGAFSGLKAANFEVVSQPGLARLDVAALPAIQLKNKQQQTFPAILASVEHGLEDPRPALRSHGMR